MEEVERVQILLRVPGRTRWSPGKSWVRDGGGWPSRKWQNGQRRRVRGADLAVGEAGEGRGKEGRSTVRLHVVVVMGQVPVFVFCAELVVCARNVSKKSQRKASGIGSVEERGCCRSAKAGMRGVAETLHTIIYRVSYPYRLRVRSTAPNY